MEAFLNEVVKWSKFELTIDTSIFPQDIILKAAFGFLDQGYFFFKKDKKTIILHFTRKENISTKPEKIIWDFSDSLLETYLRNKLEKDNKAIREIIVERAINWPLDQQNFVSLDTDAWDSVWWNNWEQNQIDFDKDIDEILKEIENDPELQVDEAEIEKILKEIEEETESELTPPKITANLDGLKKAKNNFKK